MIVISLIYRLTFLHRQSRLRSSSYLYSFSEYIVRLCRHVFPFLFLSIFFLRFWGLCASSFAHASARSCVFFDVLPLRHHRWYHLYHRHQRFSQTLHTTFSDFMCSSHKQQSYTQPTYFPPRGHHTDKAHTASQAQPLLPPPPPPPQGLQEPATP